MKTKIPAKSKYILPIITQFKTDLQQLYGSNFEQLILFGSFARGKQHPESDIDLLVLLNSFNSVSKEVNFINELKNNYLFNYEVYISVLPATKKDFEEGTNPLYFNIKKDGIYV